MLGDVDRSRNQHAVDEQPEENIEGHSVEACT